MTAEQAKEIFNIFLQDLEMDEDGNFILELRLNPDDTWSHFTSEDIKAFKMAFKSLEMWEKIVELINSKYGYILRATKYGNEDAEQQSFSYKNVLMYEVADILDDILYDIEECRKEIEDDNTKKYS